MPKLKREIFLRPTRFTHRFGERDDPLMPPSEQVFEMPSIPDGIKTVNVNGKGRVGIKKHGLHAYTEPFSPVDKANGGHASLNGPRLDEPDAVADRVPASTIMRRTAGPLIVSKKNMEK